MTKKLVQKSIDENRVRARKREKYIGEKRKIDFLLLIFTFYTVLYGSLKNKKEEFCCCTMIFFGELIFPYGEGRISRCCIFLRPFTKKNIRKRTHRKNCSRLHWWRFKLCIEIRWKYWTNKSCRLPLPKKLDDKFSYFLILMTSHRFFTTLLNGGNDDAKKNFKQNRLFFNYNNLLRRKFCSFIFHFHMFFSIVVFLFLRHDVRFFNVCNFIFRHVIHYNNKRNLTIYMRSLTHIKPFLLFLNNFSVN